VRVTHQEFGGRASSAFDVTSGRAVVCNGNLNCAADRRGHGTHCAGTAGGRNYGVAPAASVRAVKTLPDSGSGWRSWQITAIDWVTRNGARPTVLSMSLGGPGRDASYSSAINAAVQSGVTVVVAAGNDNSDACNKSPAFVASAITVGSTTSSDTRSSFSNYGRCVEIWAPGSSIVSASSSSNTGTRTMSGTSMACPHVSGAAALVLGVDPSANSAKILQELYNGAVTNAISGLYTTDTNALLSVGALGGPGGGPGGCQDAPAYAANCPIWAGAGYCSPSSEHYPFMQNHCSDTCGSCCQDTYVVECPLWAGAGYCSSSSQHYQFMRDNCALTCASCSCQDLNANCPGWVGAGYCSSSSEFYQYMMENCCGSCSR